MAIDKDVIYRKSGRGVDALGTRQAALSSAQRNLLILVDGKRNFTELVSLWSVLGDTHEALGVLLALGFIEPTATRAAPQPIRVQPPASPASRGPGATELLVPLQHAQDFATERSTCWAPRATTSASACVPRAPRASFARRCAAPKPACGR